MNLRLSVAAFLSIIIAVRADDWPQWLGPQRDGVWRETGIVERFPADGPPVKWRVEVGAGFSGPAVADGRVYVMDRHLAPGATNPQNPFARNGQIPGNERVLCLDEATGKIVWQHEYDCPYSVSYAAGPRVTPLVSGGRVWTVGTEGNLLCLDAKDGRVVWSRDFKKDYGAKTPVWGFAGHPLLDGQRLICLVGGEGSVAVAFDRDTGKELWRSLSAREPGYCPPTMIEVGGKKQVIVWHPEAVNALDPDTGKLLWSHRWAIRFGLSLAQPRQVGDLLFLSAFYDGARLFRLGAGEPQVVWQTEKASEKETTHLNCLMSTPFIDAGTIYGVCSYGQLRGLKLETGERLWETFAATNPEGPVRWGNAFIVKNGGRYFLANEKGDLIIAQLTPKGYEEISRAHLLEPTNPDPRRLVVWSPPAFANRSVFLRNDRELVCASLAAK